MHRCSDPVLGAFTAVAEVDRDQIVAVGEGVDAEFGGVAKDAFDRIFAAVDGGAEVFDDDAGASGRMFKETHGWGLRFPLRGVCAYFLEIRSW